MASTCDEQSFRHVDMQHTLPIKEEALCCVNVDDCDCLLGLPLTAGLQQEVGDNGNTDSHLSIILFQYSSFNGILN